MADPRSILAINAASFGRSLALLPALHALRRAFPKTRITAAVTRGIIDLLSTTDLVDETIDLGVISASKSKTLSRVSRFVKLARRSRSAGFEVVMDFSPGAETQLLARVFLNARVISSPAGPSFIESLFGRSMKQTGLEYAGMLSRLGVRLEDESIGIELSREDHERFEKLLARNRSRGGEPIVILHSEMADPVHRWPVERMGDLAVRLSLTPGARVLAMDDPHSRAFSDSVNAFLPRGAIRISQPEGKDFFAAIARASLLVTDDRLVARASAEIATPVVELAESASTPSSGAHRIIEGASRTRITVDEVYEAASEMLQRNRSSVLFEL
jgi:ADP-heptose:LPS heptosyltransferase